MGEHPLPVGPHHGLEIVVGIGAFIASASIADLEIDHLRIGTIDELVRSPFRRKSGAHARPERHLSFVGDQCRFALE